MIGKYGVWMDGHIVDTMASPKAALDSYYAMDDATNGVRDIAILDLDTGVVLMNNWF